MGRVTHFEIHADEPGRAVLFYEACFGWRATKWCGEPEYWLVSTGEGPGIDGGILKRMGPGPLAGQPVSSIVWMAAMRSRRPMKACSSRCATMRPTRC